MAPLSVYPNLFLLTIDLYYRLSYLRSPQSTTSVRNVEIPDRVDARKPSK